jgi:hypothetical protein
VPSGSGLCSDKACPCPEVTIARGEGYLYIDQELVDFRSRYPRLADAQRAKVSQLNAMCDRLGVGSTVMSYRIGPILVCEQGARLRKLDLETAAADARHWWKTGQVPLRVTPVVGHGQTVPQASGAPAPAPTKPTGGCLALLFKICLGVAVVAALILVAVKLLSYWDRSEQQFANDGALESVAFSPDCKRALATTRQEVRLYELEKKGALWWARIAEPGGPYLATFSADGGSILLISPVTGQVVRKWDTATRQESKGAESVPLPQGWLTRGSSKLEIVSADGKQKLRAREKTVVLVDQPSGKEARLFTGHTGPVQAVALSPNGQRVLSVGQDSLIPSVRLWDSATGSELGKLGPSIVERVVFAPDGRRCAGCSLQGLIWAQGHVVYVWDVATRQLVHSCVHSGEVTCLAFSADGRKLLTGCADGTMRLWKLPE